ncbi:MAG TPA: hypothetical protein EYP14_14450 [Planctomycetaceae bacterium]|nr:hypothetical protein [Planctomycetaceae bacterium]
MKIMKVGKRFYIGDIVVTENSIYCTDNGLSFRGIISNDGETILRYDEGIYTFVSKYHEKPVVGIDKKTWEKWYRR